MTITDPLAVLYMTKLLNYKLRDGSEEGIGTLKDTKKYLNIFYMYEQSKYTGTY